MLKLNGWKNKDDFVTTCTQEGYSDTVVTFENSDEEPEDGEMPELGRIASQSGPPLNLSLPTIVKARADTLAQAIDSYASRNTETQAPFRFNIDSGESKTAPPVQDPLYDNQIDDENSQWVSQNLRQGNKTPSDAIISCPCCFTELCFDTKRDPKSMTRYFASHAIHCIVKEDFQIHCIECDTIVGKFENQRFTFEAVVPSHV